MGEIINLQQVLDAKKELGKLRYSIHKELGWIYPIRKKEYYQENKDRINGYYKEWRVENILNRKEYEKDYRETHKEEMKEYRKNNKEKLKEQEKEYNKKRRIKKRPF